MTVRAGYRAAPDGTILARPDRTRRAPRRRLPLRVILPILGTAALLVPLPFGASGPARTVPPAGAESVRVAAGERYAAGRLRRFLLGTRYRELWTTPVTVRVLPLERFDGGLTVLREGGGLQTLSLHFASGNGRRFVFRSTDKTLRLLPGPLHRSALGLLLQDHISASHPGAALVAGPLQEAIGFPSLAPGLVVLPDDPRLGAHRSRFAGLLGSIQERRLEAMGVEHLSTDSLLVRLDSGSNQRVDASSFLGARLLDFILNDWDRHPGQWHWVAVGSGAETRWRPLPVDRDQALSWYDGALAGALRPLVPKLVTFGPEFPPLRALTANSKRLDRRFLTGISKPEWDSVTTWVQHRLADPVLERAVRTLPVEWWRISGPLILESLRARRDRLAEISDRFYRALH